jgi:hypothetical protein
MMSAELKFSLPFGEYTVMQLGQTCLKAMEMQL